MKIVVIGDIHGRTVWQSIVQAEEDADKIIFVGDYFDSRDGYTAEEQIRNFKEIVKLKRKYPQQFILLFGNHDFHYLPVNERYSGYQELHAFDILEVLISNMDFLQMCYVHKNLLFCHAGITKTWLEKYELNQQDLENEVNELFKNKPFAFKFSSGRNYSQTGDDITQSPIWVRPKSLKEDMIDNYIQTVGHTQQNKIYPERNPILVDALDKKLYLVIDTEVNAFAVKKI